MMQTMAASCCSGMTFTIEPMLNAGDYRIRTMKDGWTVKPKTAACLLSTSILLW